MGDNIKSDDRADDQGVLVIGDEPLTLEASLEVARGRSVALSKEAKRRVRESRAHIERFAAREPIYGFSRGFGQHQDIVVPPEEQRLLQRNLITSHAVSFGEAAEVEVVRLTILFRVNALALGHSGVRVELLEKLIEVLNHQHIYPYVPLIGSLGASGDLSPMSHIALTLIGEGRSYVRAHADAEWELIPSAEALARCGIEPIELHSKEGLALNNGMQFSSAQLLWVIATLEQHVTLMTLLAGCLAEAMLGSSDPYLEELHRLRPHPGQLHVAEILRSVFEGSGLREAHPPEVDPNIQDPYSSRCLPQVIGAFFDAVEHARQMLGIEINSATDNPLVFGDRVISGGHFHGMPIALNAAHVFNGYCAVVKIGQSLLTRVVDRDKNRVGISCLIDIRARPSVSSGLMIAEYSAHALGNLILSRNSAAFLHSVSSASSQEDHVSHAPTVIYNIQSTIPLFESFLGILACAATRLYELLNVDEMRERLIAERRVSADAILKPGLVGQALVDRVAPRFPLDQMIEDSYFRDQIEQVTRELIQTQALFEALGGSRYLSWREREVKPSNINHRR